MLNNLALERFLVMSYTICDRSGLPVPKIPFEEFYKNFKTSGELVSSKEWREVYSYYYDFQNYELDIDFNETIDDFNQYDQEKQLEEYTKCAESFFYFAQKYIRILHPIHGSIRFFPYKYQRRVVRDYENNRFNIISKFRQGGLTTLSVLWGMWRCLFQTDQQIMVISKTDREAMTAGEVVKEALDYLPKWMYDKNTKEQAKSKHEKEFLDTNSVMKFYTPEAARGKSITFLIIDEAAFINEMDKHWKAIYPVIATGGACCVVSTVNGLGNWYEETYHKAEAKQSFFNVIDLDYWEHPLYADPKWANETRANMGEKTWKQEVERSFLGSGETYISSNIIKKLHDDTIDNIPIRMIFPQWKSDAKEDFKIVWDTGALWIWKEPVDGHEYTMAVDCAEGMGENGDNSAFQLLDNNTMEQVAEFYSNTIPPHIYSQIIHRIGLYYNTALVVVENMEAGIGVLGNLQNELGYDNLYYDVNRKDQKPGIKLDKINRPLCLESLQHRLMTGTVKINSVRIAKELKTFVFNHKTKKIAAQRGKHDDAIMSLATAIFIKDSLARETPVSLANDRDSKENMLKIFRTDVYEEIRKEIDESSPDNWLKVMEKSLDHKNDMEEDGWQPFVIRRKNDKLLKEFGW